MTRVCAHHPSRESVEDYGGQPYCQECRHQRTEAARYVDRSTTPRECFVVRSPSGHWSALREGGAVHWVAHELSAKAPTAAPACLLGYALRVDDLLRHLLSNSVYIRDCRNFPGLEDRFFRFGLRSSKDNDRLLNLLGDAD